MLDAIQKWWKGDTPRAHVTGFYDAMKPIHKALCKKWFLNISMQYGNQWASYLDGSDMLKVPSAPDWRVRSVNNKILPLSVMQRQKLMPKNPIISTRPANLLSDKDKENAVLAGKILRAKWLEQETQEELEEVALAMVACSVGYMLTLWDARWGAELSPGAGVGMGEAVQVSASPFEIIPDYSNDRFKTNTRFIRAKIRSLDYIEARFGKKVKAQKLDPGTMYQMKAQALLTGGREDIEKVMDNHAVVLDMFELPSLKYPQGFHHICTEDEDLIEQQTLDPYYEIGFNGEKKYFLPLDAAPMTRIMGALIGTNSVEQATPAQCCLNQGESTIQENIKRLGRTKVFAEEDSIPEGAMVDNPAEIIVEFARGTIMPQVVKPPEMAQYHLNFIGSRPAAIQDAFGIHDATMGVLPRRATSGKAIEFLGGQDDERHDGPKRSMDRLIGNSYRKMLCLCANGYSEQRIRDIIGDDGEIAQVQIKGEQLRSIDVTITRDTALPESAGERMNLAIEILDKKPTTEELGIVFAIMRAQSIDELEDILKGNSMAEEVYARMENFDMAKGIARPVAPGENHQMHIKTHELMLRNPAISPVARAEVIKHIAEHHAQEGLENAQKMAEEAKNNPQPEPAAPAQLPGQMPQGLPPGLPAPEQTQG